MPTTTMRVARSAILLLAATLFAGACGSSAAPVSSLPESMPPDFEATFSQDAGMAPWFEDIELTATDGRYELWMEDVQVNVLFTPDPARIEALYAEIRNGRFDAYVTRDTDELVYDGESEFWTVEAGGERHRVSYSGGQVYEAPDTEFAPLARISNFVDLDLIVDHAALTIAFEPSLAEAWDTEVTIDLRGYDFGIGDDRWNDELQIGVSPSGPMAIPVEATRGEGPTVEEVLDLVAGDRIVVQVLGDSVNLTTPP